MAVWGAAGAAGLVVGVLLGGVLTPAFGWEAVFLVNVPLAGVAIASAFLLIPRDHEREPGRSPDIPGAATATLGLTSAVFALVEGPTLGWTSMAIIIFAAASVVTLIAFTAIEMHTGDPLLSRQLLRNRKLRTAAAIAFLFWATFGTVLYLQTTKASWRVADYDEPWLRTVDGIADVGLALSAWFVDPGGNTIGLLQFKDQAHG